MRNAADASNDGSAMFRNDSNAFSRPLPCCSTVDPERGRSARCRLKVHESSGFCKDQNRAHNLCPIACNVCIPCLGRCAADASSTRSLRTNHRRARAGRQPAVAGASLSIIDDAWCSSYPRCAIFGCCESGARACFWQSRQTLILPPPLSDSADNRNDLPASPRTQQPQTRALLEEGLAQLPFTGPAQFEQLASREEFRVLYMAQGASAKALPREYAVLRRGRRHFLFVSFRDTNGGDGGRAVHFPKSTIGEGRNLMYLLAREQVFG